MAEIQCGDDRVPRAAYSAEVGIGVFAAYPLRKNFVAAGTSAEADGGGAERSAGRVRFPRSGRLLRHADFERVYKQGRRHFSALMTVFYLRRAGSSEDASGLRVGFTVGRALGGAVQRNRMKRRLREAVRLTRSAVGADVDVVINPKKALLTAEFEQIVGEVGRAWEVIVRKLGK